MDEASPGVTADAAPASGQTTDSFQNLNARLGIGQGVDNLASGATYTPNPITRQRAQLENMYRGSWLVGQAVDCVADDMTQAGIDINSTISPEDTDKLHKGLDRRNVWGVLNETIKWSRLYGGAVAVLLVEGQDLSTPLRKDTVAKGAFKGVVCLDRWVLVPSPEIVEDYGPDLGRPVSYQVMVSAPALRGKTIHYSRVVRFDGVDLPYYQRVAEWGWGLSIVERLYDRLVAFDSTTQGTAQLVYKAHLRTISVEGFRDLLATPQGTDVLNKMFGEVRKFQSSEGLTLIDAKDKFQTDSYTFSGLSDVLLQLSQQLSGALQIPLVRLFGQSPAGLNATGDADIRNYYDLIKKEQEARLRFGLAIILDLVHRSDVGTPAPADLSFEFNSLWQMSETEKAQITVAVTQATVAAFEAGLVDRATAMKELRQSADVTGVWSNITDEDIDEAASDPPGSEDLGDVPDLQIPAASGNDNGSEVWPGTIEVGASA